MKLIDWTGWNGTFNGYFFLIEEEDQRRHDEDMPTAPWDLWLDLGGEG
jgi:hypothetical protein